MRVVSSTFAIACTASMVTAFSPFPSTSRSSSLPIKSSQRQSPRLHLFPDPSFIDYPTSLTTSASIVLPLVDVVPPSAIESSSISSADWIDALASNLGAVFLIVSLGFGVYSGAVMEEEAKEESIEGTADDAVPVEMSPKPVLTEETTGFLSGALPAVPLTGSTAAVAAPTSKKVLNDTAKAIAEVSKKGVAETKERMSSKSSTTPSSAPAPSTSSTSSTSSASIEVETKKKEKGSGSKVILQGVKLVVAAVVVVGAKRLVQALLGRGLI